jgi:hypothetical protein
MLPCEVKEATSVNDFKAKLEYHKLTNIGRDGTSGYIGTYQMKFLIEFRFLNMR